MRHGDQPSPNIPADWLDKVLHARIEIAGTVLMGADVPHADAFVSEGFTKGWLKDTAGLRPTRDGVRIRQKAGKLTVTDGPFTESKEIVGGDAIVETGTREEALELAHRFIELHRIHIPDFECESELRPCDDM